MTSIVFGIFGSMMVMTVFVMNMYSKIRSNSFLYAFVNFIGSILILSNLYVHPNIPSTFIETFWFLISIIGMIRGYRNKIWR